ncbi:MAG: GntR family transcriptional regulator, partial [Nitrosospira sp.]|nr:GntR family transcriptional regulator [Nitrosospira sp.]
YNAKRHLVRQVLIELEQMGLVERKKNIGAFVKAYSIKEVIDLYVVRDILEKSGARQIIMPVPISDIDALTAIQHQHDTAVSERSLRHAFRANIAFHKALFALSNNPTLTDAIEDFAQRAHIVRSLSMTTPYFLEKARRDHWLIIEALKQGDKEGLIKVCHDHLQPSLDAYIEQYRQRMGQEP